MNHLSPDELVDACEHTLLPVRLHHLESCDRCQTEVAQLSAILREVRAVDVPEPSPLFWEPFSSRVRAAISHERAPRESWVPAWLRPTVLVPLTALALLVIALIATMPRQIDQQTALADIEPATEVELLEGEWALVVEMVGPLDVETARQAGIGVGQDVAERAALELDAAQQQELMRLVREEIERAGG